MKTGKKILGVLLAALMAFSVLAVAASATGEEAYLNNKVRYQIELGYGNGDRALQDAIDAYTKPDYMPVGVTSTLGDLYNLVRAKAAPTIPGFTFVGLAWSSFNDDIELINPSSATANDGEPAVLAGVTPMDQVGKGQLAKKLIRRSQIEATWEAAQSIAATYPTTSPHTALTDAWLLNNDLVAGDYFQGGETIVFEAVYAYNVYDVRVSWVDKGTLQVANRVSYDTQSYEYTIAGDVIDIVTFSGLSRYPALFGIAPNQIKFPVVTTDAPTVFQPVMPAGKAFTGFSFTIGGKTELVPDSEIVTAYANEGVLQDFSVAGFGGTMTAISNPAVEVPADAAVLSNSSLKKADGSAYLKFFNPITVTISPNYISNPASAKNVGIITTSGTNDNAKWESGALQINYKKQSGTVTIDAADGYGTLKWKISGDTDAFSIAGNDKGVTVTSLKQGLGFKKDGKIATITAESVELNKTVVEFTVTNKMTITDWLIVIFLFGWAWY